PRQADLAAFPGSGGTTVTRSCELRDGYVRLDRAPADRTVHPFDDVADPLFIEQVGRVLDPVFDTGTEIDERDTDVAARPVQHEIQVSSVEPGQGQAGYAGGL